MMKVKQSKFTFTYIHTCHLHSIWRHSLFESKLVPLHPQSLAGPMYVSDTSVAFSSAQESRPLKGEAHREC